MRRHGGVARIFADREGASLLEYSGPLEVDSSGLFIDRDCSLLREGERIKVQNECMVPWHRVWDIEWPKRAPSE